MTSQPSRQLKLGTDIRAARTDQQLSLRALAKLCGVSASTISRIENGKDCMVGDLDAICIALHQVIFFGTPLDIIEVSPLDTPSRRLLDALKEGDYSTALHQFIAIADAWKQVRERQSESDHFNVNNGKV